jgi:hypothetical protein
MIRNVLTNLQTFDSTTWNPTSDDMAAPHQVKVKKFNAVVQQDPTPVNLVAWESLIAPSASAWLCSQHAVLWPIA